MWYTLLAFDIVTDLSFGEPLSAVQGGEKHAFIKDFAASCRVCPSVPLANTYAPVGFLSKLMMVPSFRKSQEMGYLATRSKVKRPMVSTSSDRKELHDLCTQFAISRSRS